MRHLLIIWNIVVAGVAWAQYSPLQSLYMYDALTVNPAYAGNKGALVLNANYRNQWAGLQGSPVTYSVTSHLLTRSKKTGLGLVVLNERFGIQNNLEANAVYSYKLNFRKGELAFGVAGGIKQESIDRNALNLSNPADMSFTNLPGRKLRPDAAVGMLFKQQHFLVGLSMPGILGNDNKLPATDLYAAYLIRAGKICKIKPSILVKYLAPVTVAYEGNVTVYYGDRLSGGTGFRNDLSGNVHMRLQLNRQLGIAYLFERNLGRYNSFLKSTHEFMINYTFDYQSNVQSPRYL